MAIKTITLKYDIALLPLNHAYMNVPRGGRILTKLAKEFKELVYWMTKRQGVGVLEVDPELHWVEVNYTIYTPKILTKAGRINKNKGDVDGQIKLFQDALCDAIGFDDCLITEESRKQVHGERPMVMVTLNVWGLATINDLHF